MPPPPKSPARRPPTGSGGLSDFGFTSGPTDKQNTDKQKRIRESNGPNSPSKALELKKKKDAADAALADAMEADTEADTVGTDTGADTGAVADTDQVAGSDLSPGPEAMEEDNPGVVNEADSAQGKITMEDIDDASAAVTPSPASEEAARDV